MPLVFYGEAVKNLVNALTAVFYFDRFLLLFIALDLLESWKVCTKVWSK
jgi:hypothetical protein